MTLMPCGVMLSSLSSGDLGAAGAWTGMVLEKELSLRQKMCSWSGSTCFWPVILCQMQGKNVYTTLNSIAFYFFSFSFILGGGGGTGIIERTLIACLIKILLNLENVSFELFGNNYVLQIFIIIE